MIRRLALLATLVTLAASANAQVNLRVATWNVTNYSANQNNNTSDTRDGDFRTSIYGVNPANGLSMSPDVFIGQEFMSAAATNSFLNNVLNGAGGPGDWAAAPFPGASGFPNSSGESVFFYRTSKISYLSSTIVNTANDLGSDGNLQPRNTVRFDMQINGTQQRIGMYSVHMKSGNGSDDQLQRLGEAQRILSNAQGVDTNGGGVGGGLPGGYHWLVAGDFNIQSASQAAFSTLAGTNVNNGALFDPINTYGSWNNNNNYRFVHTQDPRGQGGMDDRLDMILLSQSLKSGSLAYVGNSNLAYSNTTWNDPNHSYRAWGNDGTTFDGQIRITNNDMVGTAVAQALFNATPGTGGHLPVFLNLMVTVPEPGTLALLVLAASGGVFAWRRR